MGLSSLFVHKLRSMLTMLGMIFGVGAVVAMLSITAGAQKEMMSYIDLLGVNNIIIEAKEAVDRNELQARRAISPGLTFPRLPRHFGKRSRHRSRYSSQAVQTAESAAQRLRRNSRSSSALRPDYLEHQQPEDGGRPLLRRGRRPQVGAGVRARRVGESEPARLRSGGRQVS